MCEVPNSMNMVDDMPEEAGENYNVFCKNSGCDEYIEWHNNRKLQVCCKKIGLTKNITEYSKNCNFLDSIQRLILTK